MSSLGLFRKPVGARKRPHIFQGLHPEVILPVSTHRLTDLQLSQRAREGLEPSPIVPKSAVRGWVGMWGTQLKPNKQLLRNQSIGLCDDTNDRLSAIFLACMSTQKCRSLQKNHADHLTHVGQGLF